MFWCKRGLCRLPVFALQQHLVSAFLKCNQTDGLFFSDFPSNEWIQLFFFFLRFPKIVTQTQSLFFFVCLQRSENLDLSLNVPQHHQSSYHHHHHDGGYNMAEQVIYNISEQSSNFHLFYAFKNRSRVNFQNKLCAYYCVLQKSRQNNKLFFSLIHRGGTALPLETEQFTRTVESLLFPRKVIHLVTMRTERTKIHVGILKIRSGNSFGKLGDSIFSFFPLRYQSYVHSTAAFSFLLCSMPPHLGDIAQSPNGVFYI